jgi:hypothetical protein
MTYQPWTSFASLQLHAQKWDTNTVPTDYLQVCLVDPYQVLCGYLNFQRTIDFNYFKYQKNLMLWFFGKNRIKEPSILAGYLFFFKKIVNHGYARTGSLMF